MSDHPPYPQNVDNLPGFFNPSLSQFCIFCIIISIISIILALLALLTESFGIGSTIRIGQEMLCLLYVGFFVFVVDTMKKDN